MLDEARRRARGAGIRLTGDERAGTFDGLATGTYAVLGKTIRIQVDDKPAFVPWALVEKSLRRALEGA